MLPVTDSVYLTRTSCILRTLYRIVRCRGENKRRAGCDVVNEEKRKRRKDRRRVPDLGVSMLGARRKRERGC